MNAPLPLCLLLALLHQNLPAADAPIDGKNEPPKAHLEAAMKESAKVQPLDEDGKPSKREDLSDRDGTHPSDSGRQKVAELLLRFFKGDATTKGWFTGR